ncbi:MAG: PAS domain S-box protein [Polaromonas sp.]
MSLLAPGDAWPAASGEVATLLRGTDWSSTPAGPSRAWPRSLKTVLELMLPAAVEMVLFWGPDYLAFYNDAYAPTIGLKHPGALGQPARISWSELWHDLEPLLAGVRASGETFSARDRPFLINRHGEPEQVYFDISYSAVRDETQAVAGVLCVVSETTQRVLVQQNRKAREKAESDLRETHNQFRFAEAAGGIGTFLLEIDTDTLTVSAEFCRLFGLPPSHTLPSAVVESLFLREAGETFSTQASRKRGDAPLNVEYCIARADTGDLRWISRRAEFVHDDKGRTVWMRGVVQDVTDRKLAEATLRESESRFRVLAQAFPNQVWSATPEGQLDWVNQKVFDYSGLTQEQLLGDGWVQLLHPDDLPRVDAQWRHSLECKTRYEIEFRLRRHDGVYRWHLARALPSRSENVTRWLGANTDIEELKATQAALAQLNATLEQRVAQRTRDRDRMWRLATDLIVVTGTDGVIKAVNPAWQKLLGWEEHELLDTPFLRRVHEDDRRSTLSEAKKLAAGRETQRFENRYHHKDGSYRTIAWIAVPDGERIHAVGRDISAERESALALKEVEERLRQSHKMEAIGQLTGGIAHDFNNLLQGISGSLDVIRGRLASGRTGDIGHFMDSATSSAHRAAALIHRLLAFARRQSLASKTVDVNLLVVSMEDLMRRTLGEHIELLVALRDDAWPVLSDENQLESALLNLAVNARDAMPGGGTLTIRTANATLDESYTRPHEGLQPGDYTVISVSDTGVGMPSDVLARVFEPFFTTKPIGQGTGLGLSMIYGFAKQSGGHLRIHSQPGQGTEVSLYLPRRQPSTDAQVPVHESVPGGCLQAEGETILVVEDDAAVRMIVLDELNELGYTTLEAVDGPTALPILQSAQRIDLLISDVGLPGLNGRQVAEIGRQHRPGLSVLFMTGYAQSAAARSEFLAPGMEMIAKPFSMDELAAKIREMLASGARSGAACSP